MHNKKTINNNKNSNISNNNNNNNSSISNSDNSDVPLQLLLLLSSQNSMSSYNNYHCNNTTHTCFVQAKCTPPHYDHIKRLIVKLLSIFGISSILKRHRKFFRRKAQSNWINAFCDRWQTKQTTLPMNGMQTF